MRTGQTHLFIPGPTNVPETVRQAMNVPMQDMRAPDFGEVTLSLFADLKKVFRTKDATVMDRTKFFLIADHFNFD